MGFSNRRCRRGSGWRAGFLGANHLGIGLAGATLLAISVQVLITGALHEDGLADTADGLAAAVIVSKAGDHA